MTRQSEDKLIYDNHEYFIRNQFMLEEYIHTNFRVPPMEILCTACHRMYHANFEVKNNRLYLIEINNEMVDKPVNYTGLLNLYDGWCVVDEVIKNGVPCPIMGDNLVLKLWIQDGIVKKEEKIPNNI